MNIPARDLYKALQTLGKLPKTFEIKETTVTTDKTSGKSKRKSQSSTYSVIRIRLDTDAGEHSVTVDFDALKDLSKNLGKRLMDICFSPGDVALLLSYQGGDFCLFNFNATPSAELNLNDIQTRSKKRGRGVHA